MIRAGRWSLSRALLVAVILTTGCTTVGEVPPRVWVQPETPGATYRAVGVVQGKDGTGCGLYGYRGTAEAALFKLKKAALDMNADYVDVDSVSPPRYRGLCRWNVMTIRGTAFQRDE
jgi:hypothetical protein